MVKYIFKDWELAGEKLHEILPRISFSLEECQCIYVIVYDSSSKDLRNYSSTNNWNIFNFFHLHESIPIKDEIVRHIKKFLKID